MKRYVPSEENQRLAGLLTMAEEAVRRPDFEEARACFKGILEILERESFSREAADQEAAVRLERARILLLTGERSRALAELERIEELAPEVEDPSPLVDARLLAARSHERAGEYSEARAVLEQAWELAQARGDATDRARVLVQRGGVEAKLGERETGREHLDRARRLLSGREDDPEAAEVLAALELEEGLMAFRQGRHAEAQRIYSRALDRARRFHPGSQLEADGYRFLGVVYSVQGRYLEAVRAYQRALEIYRTLRAPLGQAKVYSSIGQACLEMARVDEAFYFMNKARELCVKLGAEAEAEMASLYGKLGTLYREREELDRAVEFHLKDVEACRRFGNLRALAFAFRNLGLSYRARGESEEGRRYLEESLRRFEQLGDRVRAARVRLDLAEASLPQDRLDEAEEHLRRAREVLESLPAGAELARLYLLEGILDRRRRNWGEASRNLFRAVEVLSDLKPSALHVELHLEIAQLHHALEEPHTALEHLRMAVALARQLGLRHLLEQAVERLERIDELELVRLLVVEVEQEVRA